MNHRHQQFINNHRKTLRTVNQKHHPKIIALVKLLARISAEKTYNKLMQKKAKTDSQKEVQQDD